MKYLFIVQGEGRGHLTQALTLRNTLEKNGHQVVAVMVGCSATRNIPDFFVQKFDKNIERFMSPNFLPAPKGKSSFLLASIIYNILLIPSYLKSIIHINNTIKKHQPDVVVNFYELLCGLTYGIFQPKPKMISIAHQYYFLTKNFSYNGNKKFEFLMLKLFTRFTALNANKILALSFRNERAHNDEFIQIVPPLLRIEVLNVSCKKGDYIHGYMLNAGFADSLMQWSKNNAQHKLHFFWDRADVSDNFMLTNSLCMHKLDDKAFLNYMANSKAYATTGGFESVCEAMYMHKPVLMVPAHIEQACNIIDAQKSGAGVEADSFDISKLLEFTPFYQPDTNFRTWCNSAESIYLYELVNITSSKKFILASLY